MQNSLRPLKFGKSKKISKKFLPLVLVVGVLIALAVFFITSSGTGFSVNTMLSGTSLKSTDSVVNVLLLGIAGGTHDGSSLTDTIMVFSYNLKTNQVNLFSIPRDLWLPSLQSKANAVYQIGLSQGNGLGLAKTVFGNILGLPIHYALRVDFRGFVQAIDAMDGIDVIVDKLFDDYLYPIQGKENDMCGNEEKELDLNEEEAKKLNVEPGKIKVLVLSDGQIATDSADEKKGMKYFSCRYEHLRFEKGKTKMSGAVALAFVRSRHGTGGEGSDFARSKRQQKVIEAVRNKILSLETLANPQKISDLFSALGKSYDSDISIKDVLEFYKSSKNLKSSRNFILDDKLLYHPNPADYGGAYVLVARDDDFSTVQEYVKKVLSGEITEYEATNSARFRN